MQSGHVQRTARPYKGNRERETQGRRRGRRPDPGASWVLSAIRAGLNTAGFATQSLFEGARGSLEKGRSCGTHLAEESRVPAIDGTPWRRGDKTARAATNFGVGGRDAPVHDRL